MSDVERLRSLAAAAGYRLVKGKGTVVGKHDYGRFGLKDAKTGHKAFGFGPRGVKARAEELEHFLEGGEKKVVEGSLKGSKRRKLGA